MSRFFSQKKDTKTKDTLAKTTHAFSSSDFPDLVTSTNTHSNTNTNTMNYKNKLEVVEHKIESSIKPGHISLFYDKITKKLCIEKEQKEQKSNQQKQPQHPNPSFEKLVKHWETWYDDYIELYGEDIYENVHLYPFYNYNYFNELDEIFYRELEELEKTEEAEYEDYDDYP